MAVIAPAEIVLGLACSASLGIFLVLGRILKAMSSRDDGYAWGYA